MNKRKEYRHQYYLKNKEKSYAQTKDWIDKNRKKYNLWLKTWSKEYRFKKRLEVLKHYGNKCNCCGEKQNEFLTIDHIYDGGRKHWKERGDKNIYIWLISNKYPKGYQLLCFNCNCAKGIHGKCPHNKI